MLLVFLYSMGASENQKFSDVFCGCIGGQWHEMGEAFVENIVNYFFALFQFEDVIEYMQEDYNFHAALMIAQIHS